jgi:hypothetical protein
MVLQNIDTSLFIPNLVPTAPASTLNPITGVYNINFAQPPKMSQDIVIRTVPLNATVPAAILYFDNAFTVRPVPDQPYRIDLQVTTRPSEMLVGTQTPEFAQWWQYIAYGAAKKLFEDRMDLESVSSIMPEFINQETLVNRKSIRQNSSLRVKTIYDGGIY